MIRGYYEVRTSEGKDDQSKQEEEYGGLSDDFCKHVDKVSSTSEYA